MFTRRFLQGVIKTGERGFHHKTLPTEPIDFLLERIKYLEQSEIIISEQLQDLVFTVEQLSKKCEMRLLKLEKEQIMKNNSIIASQHADDVKVPQHDARSIGSSFINASNYNKV